MACGCLQLTGTGQAKLADAGLARVQTATFLSNLETIVGTFCWCAGTSLSVHVCLCLLMLTKAQGVQRRRGRHIAEQRASEPFVLGLTKL